MPKIVKLTESDLVRIVQRILTEEKNNINESIQLANPNFILNTAGGLLKDGKGNLGCVKVEAPWPIGTFAAGITSLKMNSDGSANITPSQSSVGSITVPKSELLKLANAWNNNQMYTINKSGSTIKIGKGLVNWCRQQWKS
jgi:hypothetical protein